MITQRDIRGFKAKYHRNGVMGAGFHVCQFKFKPNPGQWLDMQAVVFAKRGCVAVTTPDPNDRWRGDDFEPALRAAIKAHAKAQPEEMYGWTSSLEPCASA